MTTALKTYKAKRNFAITPEPAGEVGKAGEALSFVIQKHWASRLHYDFRLELDGVMLSWAVPKGPSYDTHDKRMAVHVEDHPVSYNSFEGTIPAKQYGAGKVIIWDKGTWQPLDEPHKALEAGNLKFELTGHKMHGRWVLVRMKGRGEKQEPWLLIKEKDEYARPATEFSVVDEMPDSVKALPLPGEMKGRAAKATKAKAHATPARNGADAEAEAADAAAPEAPLPETLAPQLATLVDQPPSNPEDWLFEIKFDGYRLLARIDGKDIRLITRNGNDWTHKLQPLRDTLAKLKLPTGWYDGEIVVHDDKGRPDFGLLQNAFDNERTGDIVYFLFDAPFLSGRDLRQAPLEQRRAVLQAAFDAAQKKSPTDQVRYSTTLDAPPREMIAAACQMGLEGIIGKRRDAPYAARRNRDWIKLKCGLRQEFVIGGYTDPQGSRSGFGSLLLGTYDADGKLHYAGNVGSGFSQDTLQDLIDKLQALDSDTNPFAPSREIDKRAHWVKPTLVAEVSFGEWTRSGSIRHSVFQGLRADKKARTIHREVPSHLAEEADEALVAGASKRKGGGSSANAGAGAASGAAATAGSAVHGTLPATLKVSNPERVIDAQSGTTKIALVRYYALVSKLILPHLKDRPLSLVRAPSGVGGELFFQKHADIGKLPGVRQMDKSLDPSHPPMLEIATAEGLLSAAQWNTVELHTQNATGKAYETPNRVVFDLDPGKGVTWPQIQEAAMLMRSMLEQLGLRPFLKTSGGKGLHVVVPIKPQYDWDTVKSFSQAVVAHMAQTIPERFVLKSGPSNRIGKIYIDYLRNGRGSTTVSAWSARVRPGLGISVPVSWDELPHLHGGDHWTVLTAHQRLDTGNTPWDDYAKSARSLTAAMKKLGFEA
jgi:bifunctional non-homologous end joining protein LigD